MPQEPGTVEELVTTVTGDMCAELNDEHLSAFCGNGTLSRCPQRLELHPGVITA